jgi:hypothetical protein
MSFGFSGEVAYMKGEPRRTAGGAPVARKQSAGAGVPSELSHDMGDAVTTLMVDTYNSVVEKQPAPPRNNVNNVRRLTYDGNAGQRTQASQQTTAAQRNAAISSAATGRKATPATQSVARTVSKPTVVAAKPNLVAQPQNNNNNRGAATAVSKATAAAALAQPQATPMQTQSQSSSDDIFLPQDSAAMAEMSQRLITQASQSVQQTLLARMQPVSHEVQQLMSQVASVRSNLPNIVKVNDLVRTVQTDLQRIEAFEVRLQNTERSMHSLDENCTRTMSKCDTAINESNLKSYWTYATVTTEALPVYAFPTSPEQLESTAPLINQIPMRLQAGKRVLVEFPASNGPLETRFMRTRFVDNETGESSLYWLPVQGIGRFWNAENSSTERCRYLADFSVTP